MLVDKRKSLGSDPAILHVQGDGRKSQLQTTNLSSELLGRKKIKWENQCRAKENKV
jgi:hypothetical protein